MAQLKVEKKGQVKMVEAHDVHLLAAGSLFKSLDTKGVGYFFKKDIEIALRERGILRSDPRISETIGKLDSLTDEYKIDLVKFQEIIAQNIILIEKALKGDLIIPSFSSFTDKIKVLFGELKSNNEGTVADYIPQLARVNPNYFSISICTVDGQQFSIGDSNIPYCVQSTCKPINYCLALEESSADYVHKHVGREPSGHGFNALSLNKDGLPHNPMINAGAIMSCALIRPDLDISDRFDYVLDVWQKLAGGYRPGFNNAVYLSEKQTADRNFALGYFMREKKAFPENTDLHEILEFYFQCCSIEITCNTHANIAATLANAGVCPTTGERVISPQTAKNCLSLMYSCGMYDFSGEFAFTVGVPAKSGVSGALVVVIPGIMGITIWSPRLDSYGNSVKGIAVCKNLVEIFNFHNYDNLVENLGKIDPRLQKNEDKLRGVMLTCLAASQGDLNELRNLKSRGVDLNEADYDGRTPMHLAAAEGHRNIIDYFIDNNFNLAPKDRWGGTPLEDAVKHGHEEVVVLLKKYMMEERTVK